MSNGANGPRPEPDADQVLGDEAVDRALLAYLDESTAATQSALADAATQSPAARAELEAFLAADAELHELMGALGPLASSMLEPVLPAPPPVPTATEEVEPEPATSAVRPAGATANWVWPVTLVACGGALALAAALLWLGRPPQERIGDANAAMRVAAEAPPKPRRPFVPAENLWQPPVVAPGIWHYRLGETDPAAALGAPATDPLTDVEGRQSLVRTGRPTYASGLAPGSVWSIAFTPGSGFAGPVVTTATDNFCIEAWFQLEAIGKSTVVYVGHGGQNGFGLLLHDNGHAGRVTYMGLYGGNRFLDTNVEVKTGVPTHMAVVRASGQTTVYLNGRAFALGPGGPNPADGTMQIGGTAEFRGQIDEARIWVFAPGKFQKSDLLYPELPNSMRASPRAKRG